MNLLYGRDSPQQKTKKRKMNRKNFIDLTLVLALAVSLVYMGGFAMANGYTFWGQNNESQAITINYTNATGLTVNEDVLQNFSIIINSSKLITGVSFNITRINITLPAEIIYSNYSNSTGGNISGLQVLFINTSDGKRLSWANSTVGEQEYIIAGGNASFNNSRIYFNFTAYTPGKYNISVQIFYNGTAPLLTSNKTNISIRVNDTTRPWNVNVTTDGMTNASGSLRINNVSGSVEINLSAFDNGNHTYGARQYDVNSVVVQVWNQTDTTIGVNATYVLSNVTGQYWNFTLPTRQFPDGNYTLVVAVNDTNGNVNRTTNISIKIDNTAPTGSASCTPAGVNLGDTVTCSCSVTDATSGENSSVTSITGSPSTTSTGTFTQTCSFADLAGNSGTTTASYTVEQGGGGGSGAGTGGGAGTTVAPVKSQTFSKVTPGAASIVKNFDADTGVKEIQINVNNEAQNVKVSVTKYDSKPAAVSVEKTGKVFQYMQIKVDNVADKLEKATVVFKVKKTWVSDSGLTKDDVAVSKFDETAEKWNELEITYSSEDDTYYYYDAELNSFSYFAVSEKVIVTATGEEVGVSDERGTTTPSDKGNTWIWIVAGIIVLAAIIGGGIAWNKRSQ